MYPDVENRAYWPDKSLHADELPLSMPRAMRHKRLFPFGFLFFRVGIADGKSGSVKSLDTGEVAGVP